MQDPKELMESVIEKNSVDQLTRREQRALIFQILYTMESFDYQTSIESIIDNYKRGFNFDIPLDSDVVHTVNAIVNERNTIDEYYKPLLSNWRFERLGCCTRLILRYSIWELLHTDTNPTIIINEAIELAKCFAEKDAYKFINGIIDEIHKKLLEDKAKELPLNE